MQNYFRYIFILLSTILINLPITSIGQIVLPITDVAVGDNGAIAVLDSKGAWNNVITNLPNVNFTDVVSVDDAHGYRKWFASSNQGIYTSYDGVMDWRLIPTTAGLAINSLSWNAANATLAAVSNAQVFMSYDTGGSWKTVYTSPTNLGNFASIASNPSGTEWVAVRNAIPAGVMNSQFLYSKDSGATWVAGKTVWPGNNTEPVNGIAYRNNTWYAVGQLGKIDAIYTAPDDSTAPTVTFTLDNQTDANDIYHAVTAYPWQTPQDGVAQLVAVGNTSIAYCLHEQWDEANNCTWTLSAYQPAFPLYSVTWDDTLQEYVAVGANGERLISQQGTDTWTVASSSTVRSASRAFDMTNNFYSTAAPINDGKVAIISNLPHYVVADNAHPLNYAFLLQVTNNNLPEGNDMANITVEPESLNSHIVVVSNACADKVLTLGHSCSISFRVTPYKESMIGARLTALPNISYELGSNHVNKAVRLTNARVVGPANVVGVGILGYIATAKQFRPDIWKTTKNLYDILLFPDNLQLTQVAYGNGMWVGLGLVKYAPDASQPTLYQYQPAIYTSLDGYNWTDKYNFANTDLPINPLKAVAYFARQNKWYVGGTNGLLSSTNNATTWKPEPGMAQYSILSIGTNMNNVVALAANSQATLIFENYGNADWYHQIVPKIGPWTVGGLANAGVSWVAVGSYINADGSYQAGSSGILYTTSLGGNWAQSKISKAINMPYLTTVATDGQRWVAGGVAAPYEGWRQAEMDTPFNQLAQWDNYTARLLPPFRTFLRGNNIWLATSIATRVLLYNSNGVDWNSLTLSKDFTQFAWNGRND